MVDNKNLKIANLIISLTSYPARINTVNQTIETLLNQSIKAEKVILWLGEDKFPNKEKDLPQQLLELIPKGLTINWCNDIKSYTKLIPTLKKYPNAIIITADDDLLYKKNWVEQLYNAYIQNPEYIHCHRAHYVTFEGNKILPYKNWKWNISNPNPSFNNFCTGCGGTLYPPDCFYKDILREDLFMNLCPQADDIWFWAMCVLNNKKINIVTGNQKLQYIKGTQEECLWLSNVNEGKNDIQLKKVLNHYPELLKKLDKNNNSLNNSRVNVSILIPVYNVEKYLSRCLNSVLEQKFNGTFEVICVDDGSEDKSGEILEQYAQRYPNLKRITQENQGLSVARNAGVEAAQGEYVMFVDSDDYITPNAISELYDFAKKHNSEVVVFDYIRQNEKTGEKIKNTNDYVYKQFGENTFNIDIADKYVYNNIKTMTWCKFYRRDLIKNLKFAKGIRAQDKPHWALVYTKAKKINYLPKVFYYYTTHREGAAMMTPDISAFHLFDAQQLMHNIFKETDYYEKLKNILYVRFVSMLVVNLQNISKNLRQEYIDKIKNFDWDVNYDDFFNEKFHPIEKNNMRLIKYIREHDYEEICNHMERENLWKKQYEYDVSIIIPVYNVEKYLERCLNSVTRQYFPKDRYEIICVDDGSTDNSLQILENYAKQYPNIKIITPKKNKNSSNTKSPGPGEARNTGIKNAKGKYVLFADSDDFIALNSLEVLYNYAEKNHSEVVVFDFYKGKPGIEKPQIRHMSNVADKYEYKQFNADTADKFVYRFIPVAPWNKFYRLDLIKNFKFNTKIYFQDVPFWDMVYTNARRINYLPYVLYYYDVTRDDNITSSKGKKLFDVFKAFNDSRRILKQNGYFERFKYIMYAHATCNMVKHLKNINEDLREDFISEIKKFEIDVDIEDFMKEDFYKYEYANFKLIKYIQENSYDEVLSYLKTYNIIK